MKFHPSHVLAPVTLAFLAACGGGGDSGSSGGGVSGPTAVPVSTTNATPVARSTVTGATSVAQTQTSGNTQQSMAMSAGVHTAVQRALAVLADPRRRPAGASARPETASTVTLPCGVSGSVTSTFDDRDNNLALSSGDVITLAFNECHDTATSSLSGTLVVTATSVTTDTQFAASVSFQAVSVVDGSMTSAISGAVSVAELDTTSESDTTLDVGASGLNVAVTSPSYSDTITFASGLRIVSKDQFTLSQTAVTIDGAYSATSIGGKVTVATAQPVVQRYADDFPVSGQVHVTGANNSAMLVTVLDTTQVQLQVDANGDGTYESTTAVGWDTLIPQ